MICDFCRGNILECTSGKTWGHHHDDPTNLGRSVRDHCLFCTRLAAHISESTLGLPAAWKARAESGKALYRWNIRRAARTSESPGDCVTVTFRGVPPPQRDEKAAQLEYLPDEHFYLFPESDLSSPPTSDQLGSDTKSRQSWAQIDAWMRECTDEKTHPKCVKKRTDFRPTRLVDVGHHTSPWPPISVRIIETKNWPDDAQRRYVTLSHCWGLTEFVSLLKGNIKRFTGETGIPWQEICHSGPLGNKNFEEAMEVARRLQVRYIWIDSLCIVQDSVDNLDWKYEATLMHQVYRNSYCNIAASDSGDSKGGLFRGRTRSPDEGRDEWPQQVATTLYEPRHEQSTSFFTGKKWRVVHRDLWQKDLLGSQLYTRGWVFQERMLSPRILHYAHNQIFWDCATKSASESLPAGLPRQLDSRASVERKWRRWLQDPQRADDYDMNLGQFWETAVRAYTACDLTYPSDKLPAVWGVGNLVRDEQKQNWGDWGAGLWSTRLHEHLIWTVVDYYKPKPWESSLPADKKPPPSWSWASVQGTVELSRAWAEEPFYLVKNHQGGDIYFRKGNVNDPSGLSDNAIDMRCHLGEGTLQPDHGQGLVMLAVGGHPLIQVLPDTPLTEKVVGSGCEFLILYASKEPERMYTKQGIPVFRTYSGEEATMRYIYTGYGLWVERVAKDRNDRYKRLGAITFTGLDEEGWTQVRVACGNKGLEMDVSCGREIWLE